MERHGTEKRRSGGFIIHKIDPTAKWTLARLPDETVYAMDLVNVHLLFFSVVGLMMMHSLPKDVLAICTTIGKMLCKSD